MGLQWAESAGRSSYHLRMSEAWGPATPDGSSEHLAQFGSTTIRRVEVDEGLKELGVWLDGLGDWGEQVEIWRSIITPKALYPLAVASPPDDAIAELENWAWRKFLHQFGVHPGFPRLLTRIAPEAGGVGAGVMAVSGGKGTRPAS